MYLHTLFFALKVECLYFLVSGICLGKPAGSLRISYHVGRCYGYGNQGEAYTGWGSSFHMFVEEVGLESDKYCASSHPMNCDN